MKTRQEIYWAKASRETEGVYCLTIKIELPDYKVTFSNGSGHPSLVLVAGGRPPDPQWLARLCQDRETWAIDRGIDACINAEIKPSLFIGDQDSASREGVLWAQSNRIRSVIFPPEKDMTDLQIALKMAGETFTCAETILTGAFGGRPDHFFANIFSMIWAEEVWGVQTRCAADEREAVFLLQGPGLVEFSGVSPGALISTLSLSERCTGVNLRGVKWPIKRGVLDIRRPFAVSNIITGMKSFFSGSEATFDAEISSGWLGIYITEPGEEKKGWN